MFPYFCSKHRLWVPVRTARLKWGLRGSKLCMYVFVMRLLYRLRLAYAYSIILSSSFWCHTTRWKSQTFCSNFFSRIMPIAWSGILNHETCPNRGIYTQQKENLELFTSFIKYIRSINTIYIWLFLCGWVGGGDGEGGGRGGGGGATQPMIVNI